MLRLGLSWLRLGKSLPRLVLLLLLGAGIATGASLLGTDVALTYEADFRSHVFDKERIESSMEFTVEPVLVGDGKTRWRELTIHRLTHTFRSQKEPVEVPSQFLENKFLLIVSPAGLVTRVFYDEEELESLLITKKYLASALSGHFQDNLGDEWEYSVQEIDHAGVAEHYYMAKRGPNGIEYARQKQVTPDKPHVHGKHVMLDQDGMVTMVMSHEHVILFKDHFKEDSKDGEQSTSREQAQTVETKIEVKLVAKRRLQHTRKVSMSEIHELVNGTLGIEEPSSRTYTASEAEEYIRTGLECARAHKEKRRERSKCVVELRQVMQALTSSQLHNIGSKYLREGCNNDLTCLENRNLMIDIVGRLGSATAQGLILKHVLANGTEQEVERILFHFSAVEDPNEETVMTVSEMCFGKKKQYIANQRRACLTLGSMLGRYQKTDSALTESLLDCLHEWLVNHHTGDNVAEELDSSRVRNIKDKIANSERQHLLVSKSVLLHSLGNAGHVRSKRHILSYAQANQGHSEIRHTAMKALRKYTCQESATMLLNATLHDNAQHVRKAALEVYNLHPKAYAWSPQDEDIVLSKDKRMAHFLREKRSTLCNLIEHFTLDARIDFPGFDWSKEVGNDEIGASFGVKSVNFAHLHISPVEMFFKLNIENYAYIDAHVTLFKRYHFDIFFAGLCYVREYRIEGLSSMVDYNIVDIMAQYKAFRDVYNDVVQPIIDAVNNMNALLGEYHNQYGQIDIGLAKTELKSRIPKGEWFETIKDSGIEWLEETFPAVFDLLDQVEEIKADVIHRKEQIEITLQEKKYNITNAVQEYYEEAVGHVSDSVNDWLASEGIDLQVEFLDECIATIDIMEMLKDPEAAGDEVVECLQNKTKERVEGSEGLIGQMNELITTVRSLQDKYETIKSKVEALKKLIQAIQGMSWQRLVEIMIQRLASYIEENSSGQLEYINSVLDDLMMNIQHVVEAIDEATEFIQKAIYLVKDSPIGALRDIDRGIAKMQLAFVVFEKLHERLVEASLEVQGKLNAWMEGGLEHSGLVTGVQLLIERLQGFRDLAGQAKAIVDVSASPREKLLKIIKENEAVVSVTAGLTDLLGDLKDLIYLSDNFTKSIQNVKDGMGQAAAVYEQFKRGADEAKTLVLKIFGIKFHPSFPNQVNMECNDACGGCGTYPNILYGRKGIQLLAEEGKQLGAPLDSRIMPTEGSSNELLLYPLQNEMKDYEIVIANILPRPEIYEAKNGYFADAAQYIGDVTKSKCSPNFIHVSVRKLNSSMPATRAAKGTFGLLPARMHHVSPYDDTCGQEDEGEYIPVDQMYDKPDPQPTYVEGCQKCEFWHIFNLFDIEGLAEKLEEFIVEGLEEIAESIEDELNGKDEQSLEFPGDTNWDTVHSLTEQLKDEAEAFYYDVKDKKTRGVKRVEYVRDESGRRVREISYNLPEEIPVISNYFNTTHMRVKELMDMLHDASLHDLVEIVHNKALLLAKEMDDVMCGSISGTSPPKLRAEIFKESGHQLLNKAQDVLQAEMATLKHKACRNFLESVSKSEQHFCQIPEGSRDCKSLVCNSRSVFDSDVFVMTMALQFDACRLQFDIQVGGQHVTLMFQDGQTEANVNINLGLFHGVNITISIIALHDRQNSQVTLNVTIIGCLASQAQCYDVTPVLSRLWFDATQESKSCPQPPDLELPCFNETEGSHERTLDKILQDKVSNFLYSLDKFRIDKKDINKILDDSRTAMLLQLEQLSKLKSSTNIAEIFSLPDIKTEDVISKGPWDIPFFIIPIMVPPIVITVEAGGYIEFSVDMELQVLNAISRITLKPAVGSYALADGRATIGVAAVGLELRGELLHTTFNLILDTYWPNFPIENTITIRVDLIPLGVDFNAYVEVLKVPVTLRIFSWRADTINGEPSSEESLYHDKTPPEYEWASVEQTAPGAQMAPSARNSETGECLVEQQAGRHWSDPALTIEAPFYDPESLITVEYAIGTFRDGTDVVNWAAMDGATQTIVGPLKANGVSLYVSVRATNTDNMHTTVRCVLDTYDVTPPSGRMEPSHLLSSHPHKMSASLVVIEDAELVEEQYVGVGMGEGFYGDQTINWHLFNLEQEPVNVEGEGELAYFAAARSGKLTSTPLKSQTAKYDYECAAVCLEIGDGCVSFDYDYSNSRCDLHWTIEGMAADLVISGAYYNFEKLGSGQSAFFHYEDLELIHGQSYYHNARITNVRGFESYLIGDEVVVDFTPPDPGPVGQVSLDEMRHDGCSAAITQAERCVDVTPNNNHRHIIDGPGARTVFNGNYPLSDMKYTLNNHYITANWDGFHDNETDIWGYTWAAGTTVCGTEIQTWDDPHDHLADKSYWTHQGSATDLLLSDGPYYITVQALNSIVYGGALVTSVCHSTPLIVDTTPPFLHYVDDVFYDEDFDLMGIYYSASDPESGIMHTDIGLGETKHDVYVRAYSRHAPLHDGYEMVSVDGVDLPEGIAIWVRVRIVNNVELLTAGHGADPIMIDTSPPVAGSVLDGNMHLIDSEYQPFDNMMCVQWYDWFDPESGIERFLWGIGTSPNTTDVMDFITFEHYENSGCVDIVLNHSETYYNTIAAYNKALNSRRTEKTSDGVTVDITEPLAGWVRDGIVREEDVIYSSHAASFATNWGDYHDSESGITDYEVTLTVNGETREVFTREGHVKFMEDHTQHFEHADVVQVKVDATNGATLQNDSTSSGYIVDLTAPRINYLKDHPHNLHYQTSDSEMYAAWLFEDPESGITEYKYRILEHSGGGTHHKWPAGTKYSMLYPEDGQYNVETTITGLRLTNGVKYSIDVIAVNGALSGSLQHSHGIIVDVTPPVMSKLHIGLFGADENLNEEDEVIHDDHYGIAASWVGYDHESGIVKYLLAVGTGNGDVTSVSHGWRDFGIETNGYIDGLELNVTAETGVLYYVTVYAINGAGAVSETIVSRPIHVYGENVAGVVYDGREAFTDIDYSKDTMTVAISFQGFDSPACGIRGYEWALGTRPGYSDLLPFTSYGIVMLNASHAIAEVHLPLSHGDLLFASVRAHTGHKCSESVINSASDGFLIDTEAPQIVFTSLGIFGNDTEDSIHSGEALYQVEIDAIALEWNTTDTVSDTKNDTWMAGSLPLTGDKHPPTVTSDSQIPLLAVTMDHAETVIFTVTSSDMAGNIAVASAPPLTVDITPPLVEGFRCTQYLSPASTELTCTWDVILDHESPLGYQRFAIGTEQLHDDLYPFEEVPYSQYSWRKSVQNIVAMFDNGTEAVITLIVGNWIGLETASFQVLVIDMTPPRTGSLMVTTPTSPGEGLQSKPCQQSMSTMQLTWFDFTDPESELSSYEVAVGSQPGYVDVANFRTVGLVNQVMLEELTLIPGTRVYASVRVVNKARLTSHAVSAEVYISPRTRLAVWDGSRDQDVDYQNDLSSLSGQVVMEYPCPVQHAEWQTYDILGNKVTNATQFYDLRFTNDELQLKNFMTYITFVEVVDVINRTWYGRSDGIMTVLEPPETGTVRDGPYPGEDRDYQESISTLSFNWDAFGKTDDPLQEIVRYEVAVGDSPAYTTTRTNVHYFADAGLDTSYTFHRLDLVPKTVKYYGTVRAHAASGAYVDGVSNGIRVGYREGMISGDVIVSSFTSNAASLSLYWEGFLSDFIIRHYRWGIGTSPFGNDNVTLSCTDLLPSFEEWASVQEPIDEGSDTYGESHDLDLDHGSQYYVTVMAEDEAGQCTSAPTQRFTVDVTAPEVGDVTVGSVSRGAQYTTSAQDLTVAFTGFHDKESGVNSFTIQLLQEMACSHDTPPDQWLPLSETIDVKNTTVYTFRQLLLQPNIPYRIRVEVVNGAGLVSEEISEAIFVDSTPPLIGTVKDGDEWYSQRHYQHTTSAMEAVVAVSPAMLDCPWSEMLVPVADVNTTGWQVADGYIIEEEDGQGDHWRGVHIAYEDRNIRDLAGDGVEIAFHYNISTSHLEGGLMIYDATPMLEGTYDMYIEGPEGDHVIFSVTLSEGILDEYTDFELPDIEDPLTDEEYDALAKDTDLEFDKGLPGTVQTTEEHMTTRLPMTTTEEANNYTGSGTSDRDGFDTLALGVHILGFPFGNRTHVWQSLVWLRDKSGILQNWVTLDDNPAHVTSHIIFEVKRDKSEHDALWDVVVLYNNEGITEFEGVNLPENYTIKARHWSFDSYVPELVDPFQPPHTTSVIRNITVPLPKTRPCHYGDAFADYDSSVQQIYVGVANSTDYTDDIVPYHLLYDLCHSCEAPCDHYKCDDSCVHVTDDGYLILPIHLTNLSLYPGDYGYESDMALASVASDTDSLIYVPVRYYILVKAVNSAGLESVAVSPGIKIDLTPPEVVSIEAVDPHYDPLYPAAYQGHNDSLGAWWDIRDIESDIHEFYVAVGSCLNGSDIISFESVGLDFQVTISGLSHILENGKTYYITVLATNHAGLDTIASTAGITIVNTHPDISNITIGMLNAQQWDGMETSVLVTTQQDSFGLTVTGAMDETTFILEWGTGTSKHRYDVTMKQEVDKRLYDWSTMELRNDGYFWYGGQRSNITLTYLSQMQAQINMTMEGDPVDPGYLWLEPGRCLYHHVTAMNEAHLRSDVINEFVCIVRLGDVITEILGEFATGVTQGDITFSVNGTGERGALITGVLEQTTLEELYWDSANIMYRPYVINPNVTTSVNHSRHLRNRDVQYGKRSAYLTLTHSTVLTESVRITMSYAGLHFDPANQTAAILYWDYVHLMWHDIAQSCGESSHIDHFKETITGTFCGTNSSITDMSDSTQFSLHVMLSHYVNTAPVLLTNLVTTYANERTHTKLLYYDAEDDVVEFTLQSNRTEHGEVYVTSDGMLTYMPDLYFYGWDEVLVTMTEMHLISGIEPHVVDTPVRIHVKETPMAPMLFLELHPSLVNDSEQQVKVFADYIELKYEGNTTIKQVGTVYLCDLNHADDIHLLWRNQDDNITAMLEEITITHVLSDDTMRHTTATTCVESNARVYELRLKTSMIYHGYDRLELLGLDDYVLYSQPLVLHAYTMVSPCGTYGYCYGDHDPECTSTERAKSYDEYECRCDSWHSGLWCHMLDAVKITLTVVGVCWLVVIVVVAVVTYSRYKQRLEKNRVNPIKMEELKKEPLDSLTPPPTPPPLSSDSEKEFNMDKSESDDDVTNENTEPFTGMVYPDGIPEVRYISQFPKESRTYWMGGVMAPPVTSSTDGGKVTEEKKKVKKVKKTKKVKKNKVTPRT